MTAIYAVEGQAGGETLTEATARRLREQMGGRRISQRGLARQLGETPTWVNSRVLGRISMSMDDLEAIERATGISAMYLIAGLNAESRRPTMKSDGGAKYTPRDSNPEPTGYRPPSAPDNVLALPAGRKTSRPAPLKPASVIDIRTASKSATKSGTVTA